MLLFLRYNKTGILNFWITLEMISDWGTCWIDWQNSWSQVSKTVDSSESPGIIESSLTWSLRFTFAFTTWRSTKWRTWRICPILLKSCQLLIPPAFRTEHPESCQEDWNLKNLMAAAEGPGSFLDLLGHHQYAHIVLPLKWYIMRHHVVEKLMKRKVSEISAEVYYWVNQHGNSCYRDFGSANRKKSKANPREKSEGKAPNPNCGVIWKSATHTCMFRDLQQQQVS